jgi:hypothetical protein
MLLRYRSANPHSLDGFGQALASAEGRGAAVRETFQFFMAMLAFGSFLLTLLTYLEKRK